MISKNHRQNHNFQIVYFLVGSCHTPDAAYSLLLDLKEEREMALENYEVSILRQKSRLIEAQEMASSKNLAESLKGQADLLEINNNDKRGIELSKVAKEELSFIQDCIDRINPHRKYKGLSDAEACQAMQREEWCLELIRRAENFLITTRTIPADHFATMRQHPDFESFIQPAIARMFESLGKTGSVEFHGNSLIKLLE